MVCSFPLSDLKSDADEKSLWERCRDDMDGERIELQFTDSPVLSQRVSAFDVAKQLTLIEVLHWKLVK